MSFFNKLRAGAPVSPQRGAAAPARRLDGPSVKGAPPLTTAQAGAAHAPNSTRVSNGLKEFLFQMEGIGRGHLLDLGAARQTTINFFIERGYKVYSEDLLTTWKNFLDTDDQKFRDLPPDADRMEMTPAARAERFLDETLQYPRDTFDAVLLWDVLDYLDADLVSRLTTRITSFVRDGGTALAMFHARKPDSFHRYRVLDSQSLELIPGSCPFVPQRVYQNREISNLFRLFRSSKSFVGRDQIREWLFIK